MELTLRGATDTAHPPATIPIFVIHSINRPFCDQVDCWCQQGKAQITPILAAIKHGELMLQQVTATPPNEQRSIAL